MKGLKLENVNLPQKYCYKTGKGSRPNFQNVSIASSAHVAIAENEISPETCKRTRITGMNSKPTCEFILRLGKPKSYIDLRKWSFLLCHYCNLFASRYFPVN